FFDDIQPSHGFCFFQPGVFTIFFQAGGTISTVGSEDAQGSVHDGTRDAQLVLLEIGRDIRLGLVVYKYDGSLLANPKARTRLDGERQVVGRLMRLNPMMSAKMTEKSIRIFQGA